MLTLGLLLMLTLESPRIKTRGLGLDSDISSRNAFSFVTSSMNSDSLPEVGKYRDTCREGGESGG